MDEAVGGIGNSGSLVVRNTTITGIGDSYGGVLNSGTAVFESTVIRDSRALGTAGLWNTGHLTLRNSRVIDNGGSLTSVRVELRGWSGGADARGGCSTPPRR
jgi:hypothetical protein